MEIKELKEEIDELEKGLARQGRGSGPLQRRKDFTGDTAALILDLKTLLSEKIEVLTAMRREIEACFLALPPRNGG